jgi:predicted GNAT family acetyltransferase
MAGTRLHLPPYREISAVCTAADQRGRGLAGALVTRLAELIRSDGGIPLLHAATGNASAIRLYEAMGFEHTRRVEFASFRAPSLS